MKFALAIAAVLTLLHSAPAAPPDDYPADPTTWPNRTSFANSDPWLPAHHDGLREIRPRVLLVNFSNEHSPDHLNKLAQRIIDCVAEGSRYHGYRDPAAKPFVLYQVFKHVDLRDADRKKGNSRLLPVKDPAATKGFNFKYKELFTDGFAKHYAVPDPKTPGRFLPLAELFDLGYIHEIWFFDSGNVQAPPHVGAFETIELKPVYDENFKAIPDKHIPAGNGGDPEQPWTHRSIRIGFINASRGPGCFMESLSHSMEYMSHCKAIPYYTKYFAEYAGFDLIPKYKLPARSLYEVTNRKGIITYPDPTTIAITLRGKEFRAENYIPIAGNVHFPPNARADYELDSKIPVMCTMEDWRMGSDNGKDKVTPFSVDRYKQYRELAPDCMGPWLIYWRQNMPGPNNLQKDDAGKPMKNWWPFLFY